MQHQWQQNQWQMNPMNPHKLSDKDMLTDCLMDAKFMANMYTMGALESASDSAKQTFRRLADEEVETASAIFMMMHSRGWYPVQMASMGPMTSVQPPTP